MKGSMNLTIRKKLAILLSLIVPIYCVFAGFMLWNVVQNVRQLRSASKIVASLCTSSEACSILNFQLNQFNDYLLFGDQERKEEYEALHEKTQDLMRQWQQAERQTGELGSWHSEEKEQNLLAALSAYEKATDRMEQAIALASKGKRNGALRVEEKEVAPLMQDVVQRLDEAADKEQEFLDSSYYGVLVRSGSIPWIEKRVITQVQKAQKALKYFRGIDECQMALNHQMIEAKNYVVMGGDERRRRSEEFGASVRNAFGDWEASLQGPSNCYAVSGAVCEIGGLSNEVTDPLRAMRQFMKVKNTYEVVDQKLQAMIEKRASSPRQMEAVDELVDEEIFPVFKVAITDGENEILAANRQLLSGTMAAGLWGVGALAILSVVIIVTAARFIRGLIVSIRGLSKGVDRIRGGDLDARIKIDRADELGELASSFNTMTQELQNSRAEIVMAKEAAERSAAQLKASNDDLRNFTFIFSHDLRTPLINMKGFCGELRESVKELYEAMVKCRSHLSEEEQEKLARLLVKEIPESLLFIDNSVHRMDSLISSVLNLSRLARRELRLERIDLNELVAKLLNHLSPEIEFHHANVSVGELPAVVTDRLSVEMVLGHLLENAVKYLDPARESEIFVTAASSDEEVVVHIRDNGRGIAQQDREKIFDIFRRGIQDIPGEGMGLAYVKMLVARLGGKVWFESEPAKGSVFSFSLPYEKTT